MKTKSREVLLRISGLLLMVVVIAGTKTISVEAAGAFENLSAGAAEVLDSIDLVTEEELAEYAAEYEEKYSLAMANVRESMNIRQEPSVDSQKVGLLYADCGGTILERRGGWTKIQSGNLIGWANNDYLLFGKEALAMAQQVGIYKATVHASGLNIRKEPNTGADIWGQVKNGEVYEAVSEYTTDQWVAIEYGGALGYISAEYVTMEFTIDHGETYEEIEEREKRERKERQTLIVEEGTSIIGTTDDRLLAALIYMESGNQPYEGQVAVGAVVMNRVKSPAYPDTIAGVIYASGQFTPAVTGRVEELAVSGVPDSCLQAAHAAMNGESPVGGAVHFRRVGKHEGQIIGDHVFW